MEKLNFEKTLNEIGLQNNSDKSSAYHCYLDLYDRYLTPIRQNKNNILEIGILFGDSIKIFKEYFSESTIYALDIVDKTNLTEQNVNIIVGDQSDRDLLNKFPNDFFDLIIDDGSHKMRHQQVSLGVLFPKLKSGGVYIVEDLHTSSDNYRENIIHGGGLFGIETDNRTIDFLNCLTTNEIKNKYLTEQEYEYLKSNIDSLEIFETSRKNDNEFSITSVIKKK